MMVYFLIALLTPVVAGVCLVVICYIQACFLAKKYPVSALYEQRKAAMDYVCAEEISPITLEYTVKLEDQNFYIHPGYDIKAIKNAIRINLRSRSLRYGASTITQQLVKNLYFSFRKNIFRKVKELFLAAMMERTLTKEQILELYLNVIDYGNGQWGIGRAAEFYFGKKPAELTENQALFLLTLLPAPSWANPLVCPEHFVHMRDRSLKTLIILKVLSPEEADEIRVRYPVDCLDEELKQRNVPPNAEEIKEQNPLAAALRKAVSGEKL